MLESIKTYFKNPISFFRKFKNSNLKPASVIIFIVNSIIVGIINLLTTKFIINGLVNRAVEVINNSISNNRILNALLNNSSSSINSVYSDNFKNFINQNIDGSYLFFIGFIRMAVLIVGTFIVLQIINASVFKNKLRIQDVMFLSSVSYVPLVIAMIVSCIVVNFSVFLAIFLFIAGVSMSVITLYSGINEYIDDRKDQVFRVVLIMTVIAAICFAIHASYNFDSFINFIQRLFSVVKIF